MTISMGWMRVCAGALTLGVWSMCAVAQDAASVTVRDAGAEPREVLRYVIEAGQTETITIDTAMNMEMSMAGQGMPAMDLPTSRMTMESVVEDAAGGGYTILSTITDARVVGDVANMMPMIVEAMRASLGGLAGTTFTISMTDRGEMSPVGEAQIPAGASPEARQAAESGMAALQGTGLVLPEEAVGVGAVWVTRVAQAINGIEQQIETTYTLKARAGDALTIGIVQSIGAEPGPLELAEVPPGMSAELVELVGAGTGTVEYTLGRATPASIAMASNVAVTMNMSGMGMDQRMEQKIKTVMTTPTGED